MFAVVRLQTGILPEIIARKVVVADCQIFCTIYLLPVSCGMLRICTTSINLVIHRKLRQYLQFFKAIGVSPAW
jgi:hypothetical protein